MDDLILQKWDSVIVDWVNCLEIAKRIQNINALKTGEFFNALLDLLQPDLPTTVGDFLQIYYPKFELGGGGGGNVENVGKLTDPELTAAASMLLHFMCLHARRDELIAPMCQKLTGNVQTCIKHFLEHFSEGTDATQFNDVVRKAIDNDHCQSLTVSTPTKRAREWNSSGETPFVHNSPLMEYLKTPAAKSAKMQEKDREIRRLAQELQLERDEKEDLHVELKEQKKRVQKIVSEVQEKSRIISNLSARLTELEEKPPTNKPRELIEIEKVLRSELADAQQFIAELQSEQEELTLKNDEISKKLTTTEESICMWQARALQFESKLEDTVTKSKAQERELFNLQINYTELSTLLDELRRTKSNNSTLELDTSVSTVNIESKTSTEETLADTVVEIQLKECQLEIQKLHSQLSEQMQHSSDADNKLQTTLKELANCRLNLSNLESLKRDVDVTLDKYILTNEMMEAQINKLAKEREELSNSNARLQDSLNESIDQSQKLEDELSDVKGKLEEVNNNNQELETRHGQLIADLEKLKKSEENLFKVNSEYRQNIEGLNQEILGKDQDIVTVKSYLLEREEVITKNEDLVRYLRRNLEEVEQKRDHFKEKLDNKEQMYLVLEEESRQLQLKYEEAIDLYNTTDFNLNALKDQIRNSDTQFQVCIDRLDELLTGSINLTKLEKLDRLEGLLDKLQSKQMTFENTIDTLNAVNCKWEESFNMLQEEDDATKKTLENVQQCLDQSKERVESLENDIRGKVGHIKELENRLHSLSTTVQELENMKKLLSRKELENVGLCEQNETLTLSLQESSCKIMEFEQLQADLNEKVSLLSKESCERFHKAEELERHLSDVKLTAEELEEVRNSLQIEVESAKLFGEAQKKQHDELLQRFLALQDDFSAVQSENAYLDGEVVNLGRLNSELLLQIKELQSTIEERTQHSEDLLQKIEELLSTKDKERLAANDTINGLQLQLKDVKNEVVRMSATIENMQGAIEDQNKNKQELEQKCEDILLEKQELEENSLCRIESLEGDVNRLQAELNSCKENISSKSIEINVLQTKLSAAIEDMQKTVEEQNDLEQKCAAIQLEKQRHAENSLQQIESLQADVNKLQDDLKSCGADISFKQTTIDELKLLADEKSAAVNTLQNKLAATIADMEKTIDEHTQKKEELEQKCTDIQLAKQQLKENSSLKIETLQGNVSQLEEILRTYQEDISLNKIKIGELQLLVDEKSSITETLECQLVQLQGERKAFEEETNEKLLSLGIELDSLKTDITHLNDDNNSKMKTIEELQSSLDQQNHRCQEFEKENKQIIEDSQKEVRTLNGSISKMDHDLTISQKKINGQLQIIEDLKVSVEEQENKILDLNKQVKELEMERTTIMEEAAEKINTLQEQISTLLDNLASNDTEIVKLKTTINQLDKDKRDIQNELREKIKFLEEENILNKKTITELIDEIDSQLLKLTAKDSELTAAKEAFSNKDLASMQSINDLNNRLNILTVIKVNLETDLMIAKDEIALKVKELEDMDKSKAHLEKQLNKTIQQHEKKSELMQLTIDNLETKVMALSDETANIESDFERETLKLLEVSNEKNNAFEEMRLLKEDLSHIKKQLKEKEAECSNKDDILEKNTVELLSLKLDIEMKLHEISTLKTTANNLEHDKSRTMKMLSDAKDEIKRMNLEHQTTLDELKVVNNIKASLKEKIDHFKDNMQNVFAHFEIKKKNMKQSLDDLMQYKTCKDAEIKRLNSQLIETRADLENQREEIDSVRKDMQKAINSKQKEVKLLEDERDAMRITEAGYLQDIANLKEELNDTIDKYTAALAAEKDQKAENDIQIQGLTESLHEMVKKYNILDAEYKELTNVLDYNKKSYEELKGDKDSLSLDIVRLKNEYEEDAKNCKAEFQAELKTLKKIEDALTKDIEDLNNQLRQSREEGNTVDQELQDAKNHLHIIQCEKAELVNKLGQMDLANTTLKKEYESLKIAKEEFMKESKASLIRKQDLLQETKKSCEATIAQKDKDIARLKKEVCKYSDRLNKEEDNFKKELAKKDKEMGELHNSIANFLQNIETLTKERDGLRKKLEQHQNLVAFSKEQEETIASHLKQIQNLKVSVDVLDAGKSKMGKLQADLENRLTVLQKQAHDERNHFEATKSQLQSQLDRASTQLKESELVVKEKVAEIEAANDEFDSVQAILTNMSKKMETTSRQLSVIHEDYEGKLKAERATFEELKRQYETTVKEMQYMSGLNGDLRMELQEAQRERLAAEETLRVKEDMISELQQKYDSVASVVDDKDAALASLQAQLAAGLERLAAAANARQCVEGELRRAATQLAQIEAQKEELVEQHAGALSVVEESLLCTERQIKEIVNSLEAANCGHVEVERMLSIERDAKVFLEKRVVDLEIQVQEAIGVKNKLQENIRRLCAIVYDSNEKDVVGNEEDLDETIMQTERKLIIIFGKLRDLETIKEVAEQDLENAQEALLQMEKCSKQLNADKDDLIANYEKLHEEKAALLQDKAKDTKSLENMKTQYESLKEKASVSTLLEEKLLYLEHHNKAQRDIYTEFTQKSRETFKVIESMISDRNSIEQVVYNLKDQYTTLQIKSVHITEDTHKLHYEQKSALEIIIDDIYKQFRRLSKMIYNLNLKCHQTVERTVAAIMDGEPVDVQPIFKALSGDDIVEKLEELKDNANNTQVQLEQFLQASEILSTKEEKTRVLKENLQPCKQPKEDEWRKKYLSNKQKLILVENAKNNFEKKIKQLRDEIKKLRSSVDTEKIRIEIKKEPQMEDINIVKPVQPTLDSDVHYKKLLQEFIQLKDLHQQETQVWTDKCQQLEGQLSTLQTVQAGNTKNDSDLNEDLETELSSLKLSYRDVKIAYSKLQLDYSALEKLLNDRTEHLTALTSTKESYSILCEENTKLQSEIDTIKYKRQRDREQFLQHIKKLDAELSDKVTAVRGEYDLKVEKIKEKIVAKYQEQMNQNAHSRYEKIIALKKENDHIKDTVDKLKDELAKAQAKNDVLDTEKQFVLQQLKVARHNREEVDFNDFKEPTALSRRASSHSLQSELRSAYMEERRSTFSLPRNIAPSHQIPTHGQMDIIEEVRYRRTSSVASSVPPTDLQMEDEGDMFNNKYLHDLKEGRPSTAANGRESYSSRLSEFAYRNSLCPPHLKSSYPAETQFLDHKQFKEDDLKSGNMDFGDDTMKTHLLPSEKPKKKDAGTTSYKKPGPPTPSKHGGRLSLQGNERVLREIDTDQKQQRQSANPLRGLFSSSKSKVAAGDSGSGNGENTGTSPKKRPSLSFFRR